jgi:hypothetical protein
MTSAARPKLDGWAFAEGDLIISPFIILPELQNHA